MPAAKQRPNMNIEMIFGVLWIGIFGLICLGIKRTLRRSRHSSSRALRRLAFGSSRVRSSVGYQPAI
jgi:hypothetical protein